jgi:hypothetical protein
MFDDPRLVAKVLREGSAPTATVAAFEAAPAPRRRRAASA